MPDYTAPITVAPGDDLPAADWNLGVRDNFAALGGGWTAYVPVWTGTIAPVIGNGTLTGTYRKFGQTLDFRTIMVAGSTTTYGTIPWTFSLPPGLTASGTSFADTFFVVAGNNYEGKALINPGASTAIPLVDVNAAGGVLAAPSATVPGAWASGAYIIIKGTIPIT